MINWNTVPMTYNDSLTYLEMMGKVLTVVQQMYDTLANIEIDSEQIHKNAEDIEALQAELENYYTKTFIDANFPTFDDVYTVAESLDTFATVRWANKADERLNALESYANQRKGVYFYHLTNTSYSLDNNAVTITVPSDHDYDAIETKLNITISDGVDSITTQIDSYSEKLGSVSSYQILGGSGGTPIIARVQTVSAGNTVVIDIADIANTHNVTIVNAVDVIIYAGDTDITPEKIAEYYTMADADGDGSITISDATLINQFYAMSMITHEYTNDLSGWTEFLNDKGISVVSPVYPDANRDGIADMVDALAVNEYAAHVLADDWADTAENWYLFSIGQTPT